MKALIQVDSAPVPEVKGLGLLKARFMTRKTGLNIFWGDGGPRPDMMGRVPGDISLLGMGDSNPSVKFTVEGAKNIGRILNRSIPALEAIALSIPEVRWEDTAGVWDITPLMPLYGTDLGPLLDIISRVIERARGRLVAPMSHKPYTNFNFRNLIGLAYDARHGDNKAVGVLDWMASRESVWSKIKRDKKEAEQAANRAERKEKERIRRHRR